MVNKSNRRRRNGGRSSTSGASGSRTLRVAVAYRYGIAKAGAIDFDTENFPGLKTYLDGCIEWRVTQASAEYSTLDPVAKGAIALGVFPHDWTIKDVDSIVASGGVQFPASSLRRATPSFGGFPSEWRGSNKAAAMVAMGAMSIGKDAVGRVVVKASIVVRGVAL